MLRSSVTLSRTRLERSYGQCGYGGDGSHRRVATPPLGTGELCAVRATQPVLAPCHPGRDASQGCGSRTRRNPDGSLGPVNTACPARAATVLAAVAALAVCRGRGQKSEVRGQKSEVRSQ